MSVCTKERKGVAAEVLMATPCTTSLGGESEGHKHEGWCSVSLLNKSSLSLSLSLCGVRRLC